MSLLVRRSPQLRSPILVGGGEIALPVSAGAFTLTGKDIGFVLGTAGSDWWDAVPLLTWHEIANSTLTSNLGTGHITRIGGTINAGAVTWGANVNGYTATQNVHSLGTDRGSYGGMADYGGKIYLRNGDAFWGETGVHAFDLVTRTWQAEVFPSSMANQFDNLPQTGSNRNLDGWLKGCHSYWQQHYIGARDWFMHVSDQQWWPNDNGGSAKVTVFDIDAGTQSTIASPVVADHPFWANDWSSWQQKHPVTEDIYVVGKDVNVDHWLGKWNQTTNSWSTLCSIPDSDGSGSINWDTNELVFAGNSHFVVPLASPSVTAVTFPYDPGRRGGIHYCPDRGTHLGYFDDGLVYEIFRDSATVFSWAGLSIAGTGPANLASENSKAGGILNNWKYVPELSGMVLRLADNLPMYYIRTA